MLNDVEDVEAHGRWEGPTESTGRIPHDGRSRPTDKITLPPDERPMFADLPSAGHGPPFRDHFDWRKPAVESGIARSIFIVSTLTVQTRWSRSITCSL